MLSWSDAYQKKVIAQELLAETAKKLRSEGKSLATLNGSFDLLHAGHLQIIFEASQLADILIVALNSDASIRRYKSKSRPIVSLKDRLQMMAALSFVDFVTYFEETDPRGILSQIRPDIHVNGAEYGKSCLEAETVEAHGGRIHIAKFVPGLSTSNLLSSIQQMAKSDAPHPHL